MIARITIKTILMGLFLICLLDMPYGYYQMTRFLALVGFSFLGYQAYKDGRKICSIMFVCLAILFQPLIKISLGRAIWNIVDVVAAIGLLGSIFINDILRKKIC